MLPWKLCKSAIALILMCLVCCSPGKSVDVNGNSTETPPKTTYWVILMNTLIGTGYVSEVCPLPVDDKESVAAAANGWGKNKKGGLTTGERSVYGFASPEEAEKFRREKKSAPHVLDLKLAASELIKYLCVGQPSTPPADYWVVIMRRYEDGREYISEVYHLPPDGSESILAAAHDWGIGKGFMTIEGGAYKFTSREEAEKFRLEKGLPSLNLSADSLNKYLCADRPNRSSADTKSP